MSSDRIVSLVPSVTDALDRFGVADRVIGVTTYCTHGAPDGAERVGGTKNPDVQRIIALRPDLVVTNTEENRPTSMSISNTSGAKRSSSIFTTSIPANALPWPPPLSPTARAAPCVTWARRLGWIRYSSTTWLNPWPGGIAPAIWQNVLKNRA